MQETWYLLEDGRTVDPSEVAPDEAGVLRHASGVAVKMRGEIPHTRGVDPEAERAKAAQDSRTQKSDKKDMKPDDQKPGYKTRDAKGI
jgi:hypothetical protein